MINLKVLSTAAALTLALPLVATGFSAADAQERGGGAPAGGGGGGGMRGGGGGGGGAAIGGGGGMRGGGAGFGGGGGAAMGGGGFARGGGAGPAIGGGGGFARGDGGFARGPAVGGGGMRPGVERGAIAGVERAPGARPVGPVAGNNWNGGNWRGGHYHRRHGGFWPGFAVGAGLGSAYGYYGNSYYGSGYYDNSYYDEPYYDDTVVAAGPAAGDDSVAYCQQRYKSYDPASGTYLGYDGQRHPCPAQ